MIITRPFCLLLCFFIYSMLHTPIDIICIENVKIPLVYDTVLVCVLLTHCVVNGYNTFCSHVFCWLVHKNPWILRVENWNSYRKIWNLLRIFNSLSYDTQNRDPNEISLLTSMNIERLRYIPAILIHSPGGLFLYDDNIYDIDMELVEQFSVSWDQGCALLFSVLFIKDIDCGGL